MNKSGTRLLITAVCSLSAFAFSQTSRAANLVSNGSFEASAGGGQLGFNTSATDWSIPAPNGSYNFLFTPGTADNGGVNGEYGNVQLWGPNNGSGNGLPATSPDGGNYVASDGDFQQGALSQTIGGLTVGGTYSLSFDWAAAQQAGFTGASTEQWQVGFGSDTLTTPVLSIPSAGFSGWQSQSFSFTASSTSEVLSFLALGTPNGVPTFALLDGVSMQGTVPDTASTAVLFGVVASAMGIVARCRRPSRE